MKTFRNPFVHYRHGYRHGYISYCFRQFLAIFCSVLLKVALTTIFSMFIHDKTEARQWVCLACITQLDSTRKYVKVFNLYRFHKKKRCSFAHGQTMRFVLSSSVSLIR